MIEITPVSNDGNEFYVSVSHAGKKLRARIPRDFLDDNVGDDTSSKTRRAWIENNSEEIRRTVIAKHNGGFINRRFEAICVDQAEGE